MRINCIPVDFLADVHLFAEYREIKMLPKAFLKSKNSKNGILKEKISKKYILNTGHGYFFYDKLNYIYYRFKELKTELKKRNFNIQHNDILYINDKKYLNDWVPNKEDMLTSFERIYQKIMMKPDWYKFHHEPMNKKNWEDLLHIQKELIIKGI
ncbi:hypothetical protein GW796_05735 [archaeon]|nr:hypothetical protein [archaeon]NCQ51385.1 hypothetical protein [archaeon]NCT58789.1 hypothetical protein [archaeon]